MGKTSKTTTNKPRLTKAQLSKEIEVKLSAFVDSSIESFVLLDENLNYMFLNPTAEKMIGVSREAVVGKNILDIAPNIKESGRYDKYLNVLRTGEPFSVEDAVSHTKFGVIELSLKAFKVGNWLGVIATDIPERKQADDALRDSEERYRTLFENMLEGFAYCKMSFDDHGRPVDWVYLAVNRAFEQLTALKNIVGKRVTEAIPGIKESNPELFEIYGRVALTGRSERFVIEIKSLSMWLNISVFSPAKEYFVAVFENITERKKVEEALKEIEEKWRSLSENSPDYIALLDLDATVLYVNRTVPDLTKEDIIGASAFKYVPPEFHQTWSDCFKRVAASGKPDMLTAVYHTKEGGTQYLEVRIGPVFKNGQVVAFISSSTDITERKKAEEALRQSEEYFHSLTDNAVDVILVIGADGVRKYVSPSIERVRGYKPEELIGKEAIEGVHPDDVPQIADIFVQLTENPGKLLQWECRLRHKDGTWRIVEGISRNFFDNPVVAGIVSNYRDITERKKAGEALRESEERYRALVEAAGRGGEGIIIIQDSGEREAAFVFVNDEFCKMSGYSREELLTRSAWDLVPPEVAVLLKDWYKRRRMGEDLPDHYEAAGVHKDGTIVPLELSVVTMPWQGKIATVLYMRDITERKRMEEALKLASAYNRNLIEVSLDPLVTIGPDGRIADVNAATEAVTGYVRDQLIGTDFSDYFTDPQKAQAGYQQVFREGKVFDYALDLRHRNGHVTSVLYNASVYRDEVGRVIGVFAAARDIMERKRMEEALRKSEQTIRRLAKASTHAHEEERQRVSLEVHDRISQTLTAAFHQLQALESIPIENTDAEQILKRASALLQESIRESRSIMEDLYSPVLSDFGIVAVIDEELRRFEEETGCRTKFDKRCAVRPTPDAELTAYRIFREVLANIKRHAIGASKVEVSLSCEAGVVSLQVKDNGPGFDVEAALQNMRMGGLKGMQRRAELGGGTCEVISSRGHGTTVTVRLPYSSEA